MNIFRVGVEKKLYLRYQLYCANCHIGSRIYSTKTKQKNFEIGSNSKRFVFVLFDNWKNTTDDASIIFFYTDSN